MDELDRLPDSAQAHSPGKEKGHDKDPMSAVRRTQQAALRFYEVQLWSSVMLKLKDAETLVKYGRKDLALQHVAVTRRFIADWKGTEKMELACQDTEDIIRHWPGRVPSSPQSSPRRRHSTSRLQSPETSSQRINSMKGNVGLYAQLMEELRPGPDTPSSQRVNSLQSNDSLYARLMEELRPGPDTPNNQHMSSLDSDLYARLLAEVQQGPDTPSTHTSQQQRVQSPPPVPDDTSRNATTESNGSFEGIQVVLNRLRQGSAPRVKRAQPPTLSRQTEAIRPDTVQMVNGWGAQLPNSPSSFKNSEETSPRRHSFPYASPQLPGSPSARKASIHAPPQPLLAHDSRPSLDASVSAADSASNYSRRLSQDETSTVLSDTPSLTKLVSQIHTNPFTDGQSVIASRVRKLSIEYPTSEQLAIGAPSAPGHSDSPPCSPLSQTFTPDDLPPEPVSVPSPSSAPLSRKVPPPLLLNAPARHSGQPSTLQADPTSSPHNPSPLREEFSATEPEPVAKEEAAAASLTQGGVVFRKPTFSSRIPRPTRRASQPSTPTSPTSPPHKSAEAFTNNITGSAVPRQDSPQHLPVSPTSTPPATLTDTPALPFAPAYQAAATPTPTTTASASSNSSSSSTRLRKRDSVVSRMAAQLEHQESQSGGSSGTSSRGNAAQPPSPSSSWPVTARPPWQMPGRTKTKTPTTTTTGSKGTTRRNSEQAGFVKWEKDMVRRGSGAPQSQ